MLFHSKNSLYEKLRDPKYRAAFLSSRIKHTIASQVRMMRQREDGMSQSDLARKLGTSQNAIYRLENPKSGKPNISTLERIAAFFGVGLIVRFAPLSEVVDWTLNMSPQSIDVAPLDLDAGFSGAAETDQAPVSTGFLWGHGIVPIAGNSTSQITSATDNQVARVINIGDIPRKQPASEIDSGNNFQFMGQTLAAGGNNAGIRN